MIYQKQNIKNFAEQNMQYPIWIYIVLLEPLTKRFGLSLPPLADTVSYLKSTPLKLTPTRKPWCFIYHIVYNLLSSMLHLRPLLKNPNRLHSDPFKFASLPLNILKKTYRIRHFSLSNADLIPSFTINCSDELQYY